MNAKDKELLEMAARAAGYVIAPHVNRGICNSLVFTIEGRGNWNPLRDDGDALRLAVKLGLSVRIDALHPSKQSTVVTWCHEWMGDSYTIVEFHDEDRFATTRRAIVSAAAEIGKSMTKESDHEH